MPGRAAEPWRAPDPRGQRAGAGARRAGPSRSPLSPLSPLPSSRRLVTLARGLAPAFLRFAGKRTDFLQFHNVKNPAKSRGGPGPDYYLKNYEDGERRRGPSRAGPGRTRGAGAASGGSGGLRAPCGPAPPARAPWYRQRRAPRRGRAVPCRARAVLPSGHRAGDPPPSLPLPEYPAGASPGEQKARSGERGFPCPPGSFRSRTAPQAAEGPDGPRVPAGRAPLCLCTALPGACGALGDPCLSPGTPASFPCFSARGSPPHNRARWRLGRPVPACRRRSSVPGGIAPRPARRATAALSQIHSLPAFLCSLPPRSRALLPGGSAAARKVFTFCGP